MISLGLGIGEQLLTTDPFAHGGNHGNRATAHHQRISQGAWRGFCGQVAIETPIPQPQQAPIQLITTDELPMAKNSFILLR